MPISPPPLPRHARLFRNGSNQAVRIPRELEIAGEEVLVYREGNRLILEPVPSQGHPLAEWLATLPPEGPEMPPIPDPPAEPEDFF